MGDSVNRQRLLEIDRELEVLYLRRRPIMAAIRRYETDLTSIDTQINNLELEYENIVNPQSVPINAKLDALEADLKALKEKKP
jgi:predicted  nucleic acid-binding Zn-ribbon protein